MLISDAFPADKRGAAIGLWGGIAGLAVAAGPVVGGAVISGLSWHWIFWLNMPIGLALIPLAARRLTESFGPHARLDIKGLALAGSGTLGLIWGLLRANTIGRASPEVIATLVGGAILIAWFVTWSAAQTSPCCRLACSAHEGSPLPTA
jgi:MFS family permease